MATKQNNASFVDAVKDRMKTVNKFIIETAEEVVDMGIKRTGEWQEVTHKAIKGGLKVSAKQQDLVFDALESAKKQITTGTKKVTELAK